MSDDLLQAKWNLGFVPVMNGILHRNGRLVKMSVRHWQDLDRSLRAELRTEGEGTVELSSSQVQWVRVGLNAELLLENGQYRSLCGDGGLDGDGFVCVVDAVRGSLVWLAFFEDSGSFVKLEQNGEEIRATATDGLVWSFPLASPEGSLVLNPAPKISLRGA
jgi:hypothetical protein